MKKIILSLLLLTAFFQAQAQLETAVDPDFVIPNQGNSAFNYAGVNNLTLLPDGKILVSGFFDDYKTIKTHANSIVRILPNGQHDPTFSRGIATTIAELGHNHSAVILLPSGNIVTAGFKSGSNSYVKMYDSSGASAGMPVFPKLLGGNPTAMVLQPDGKLIVAGAFASAVLPIPASQVPLRYKYIIRFNQNGTIDDTFNVRDAFAGGTGVNALALQADGKIIASGRFTSYKGNACSNMVRINPDGSIDPSFTTESGFEGLGNEVQKMKLLSDGKMLIGGRFTKYRGVTVNGLMRLESNGTIDSSFNPITHFDGNDVYMYDLQIKNDKIFMTGSFNYLSGVWARPIVSLNMDGSVNTTFDATGFTTANKMLIHPNGKIYIATSLFRNQYKDMVALNDDGSEDRDFHTGTRKSSFINKVQLEPDGKITIAGLISSYAPEGSEYSGIVRLNPDGSQDTGFVLPTHTDNENSIASLTRLPNGKYLVSGHIPTYDGVATKNIIRLNQDGTLDDTFNLNTGIPESSFNHFRTVVQPDGKIIAAYEYPQTAVRLLRLNADGSADTSFTTTDQSMINSVTDLALQPDGKILVASSGLTRFNSDGSRDLSFVTPNNIVFVNLLPDGKMYVYNGNSSGYFLRRLNADGTLDASFVTPPVNNVGAITVQADQKILVGHRVGLLERYHPDGSVDPSFQANFNNEIHNITIPPDGKLLVAGEFCVYNDTTVADLLIRLEGQSTLGVVDHKSHSGKITAYPNPVKETLSISLPENTAIKSFQVYDLTGKKISGMQSNDNKIDVTGLAKGLYILEIITDFESKSIKFIKD